MDFSKAKGSKTLKAVAEKSASVGGLVVTQVDIESLVDNPDNEYLFGMKILSIPQEVLKIMDLWVPLMYTRWSPGSTKYIPDISGDMLLRELV